MYSNNLSELPVKSTKDAHATALMLKYIAFFALTICLIVSNFVFNYLFILKKKNKRKGIGIYVGNVLILKIGLKKKKIC